MLPRRRGASFLFLAVLLLGAAPEQDRGVVIDLHVDSYSGVTAIRLERADMPGRWRTVETFETWRCANRICTYKDPHAPSSVAYRAIYLDAVGNESAPAYVRQTEPNCRWEGKGFSVPIECGDEACDCKAAAARLQAGADELVGHELLEPQVMVGTLEGLRVRLIKAKIFNTPKGEKAEGLYDVDAHLVLLGGDGCAALHELMHAALRRSGVDVGPEGHAPWEASPLLRELDERFQAKWRGKSLWAPRRR